MSRPVFTRRDILALMATGIGTGMTFAQPAAAPLRLMVPFTPGTGIDLIARTLGPKLSERLNRPVVVENRVGASGNIGTEAVVRAAPDGSTLLVSVNTLVMNRSLYPQLSFDPIHDLEPISQTSWGQLLLVTHPNSGFRSATELAQTARRQPGKINYASPGVGTPHHLAMELLKNTARIFLTHIPYRGTGPAVTDLLGGQVSLLVDSLAATMPHIKSGKIRPLAISTLQRVPQMPDLPTVAETFPGFEGVGWAGLVAPKGTPQAVIDKISEDTRKILSDPKMRDMIMDRGMVADMRGAREWGEFVNAEVVKWAEAARKANLKAD